MFNNVVPNQRDKSKAFIGGYFERSLAAGVGLWLNRPENRRRSASDFLFEALIEKLASEGIKVELEARSGFGDHLPAEAFREAADTVERNTRTRAKIGASVALPLADANPGASSNSQKAVSTTYKTVVPGVRGPRRRDRQQTPPNPVPK